MHVRAGRELSLDDRERPVLHLIFDLLEDLLDIVQVFGVFLLLRHLLQHRLAARQLVLHQLGIAYRGQVNQTPNDSHGLILEAGALADAVELAFDGLAQIEVAEVEAMVPKVILEDAPQHRAPLNDEATRGALHGVEEALDGEAIRLSEAALVFEQRDSKDNGLSFGVHAAKEEDVAPKARLLQPLVDEDEILVSLVLGPHLRRLVEQIGRLPVLIFFEQNGETVLFALLLESLAHGVQAQEQLLEVEDHAADGPTSPAEARPLL